MTLKEQAVSLYLSGFPEDTAEFARGFIEEFFDTNCCYLEEDGKLLSMLFMFDCTLFAGGEELPVSYVYAVVTHPEYRGRGFMRSLMEKAKKEALNKAALIIKPSNESLYAFYQKLGFKTAFYFSEADYERSCEGSAEVKNLSSDEYNAKREELLKDIPHISWIEMMEYIGKYGKFLGGEDFCALAEKIDNNLFIREFLGNREALDALLTKLGKDRATVRTMDGSTPFGMICPLKDIKIHDKMYMGFAMD